MKRGAAVRRANGPRLTLDQAFLALFIAAMDANGHVSPEEAARAHHIIWSMKRFRRKSGETVNQLIDAMRTLVDEQGPVRTIAAATRVIPPRLRAPAFALASDLVLADGRIEGTERRFLNQLAADLQLDPATRDSVLGTMRIKNSA